MDIYYYSYYLLLAFCAFYTTGWASQRLRVFAESANHRELGKLLYQHLEVIILALAIVWSFGCYRWGIPRMTTYITSEAILDGSLRQYDSEYSAIIQVLESGASEIEIKDIETVPPFFSNFEFSEDASYWTNSVVAEYFGVDSIKLASD